ncbi:MAG TPA: protein kinase [Ktedonobacterales bacterium]|jgi:hypothetical protein
MARLEGQTIGGWHLQNYLGAGEHGEVYLVEQAAVQKRAVMRIVQLRSPGPQAPAGPSLAGRFSQEAQRLVELRHQYILPLYEYGQQNDLGYLVAAYTSDGSLQDAFTPGRPSFRFGLPLDPRIVGSLLNQVCAALTYAHERNLFHGNIKPANLLISTDAGGNLSLLLSDFGLSRLFASSPVTASTVFYAAPELFYNQLTAASDQYSLAMVVYQLLTGRLPFGGESQQVMQQQMQAPPTPLRSFNPNVPPMVETVVLHALAKHPITRWPSVAAFALAYQEALIGRSSVSQPAGPGYAAMSAAWPAQPAAPGYAAMPAQPAAGYPQSAAVPAPVPVPVAQQRPATPPPRPAPAPAFSQQQAAVTASGWNPERANEDWMREPPTNPQGYGPRPVEAAPAAPQVVPPRSKKLWFALGGVSLVAVALAVVLIIVLVGGKPAQTGAIPGATPGRTAAVTPTPTGPQMILTDQFVTAIATTADTVAGDGECDNTFPTASTPEFQTNDTVMIVYTANLTDNQLGLIIRVNKIVGKQSVAMFSPVPPLLCAGEHTYVTPFHTNDDTQKGFGTYRVQIACFLCRDTGAGAPDATIFFKVN